MPNHFIQTSVREARAFFSSEKTKDLRFRGQMLDLLKTTLKEHEQALLHALHQDLGKSAVEAYMTEIGIVYDELKHTKKHLRQWAAPEKQRPGLGQLPATLHVYREPYGVCLLISPWNYPVQLCFAPLIAAMAAGNVCLVKTSSKTPHVNGIIKTILSVFPEGYITYIPADDGMNDALFTERYDKIFFTGSPNVGKTIMKEAAKHLTPVTLELGGKSPALVDESADIAMAAKRIAFGKLVNAGQTCVAPDHVYVHHSVKDALMQALKEEFDVINADEAYRHDNYPRMISKDHYDKVLGLLEGQQIYASGTHDGDRLQIAPTIVDEPALDSPIMQQEIFGPLLPVLAYDNLDTWISEQKQREKPLALYHFTQNPQALKAVRSRLSYGGGCINDTLMHLASPNASFGGVGQSGMGHYHGKYGFDTFSHQKTVLHKAKSLDLEARYHPYKEGTLALLKKLLG